MMWGWFGGWWRGVGERGDEGYCWLQRLMYIDFGFTIAMADL